MDMQIQALRTQMVEKKQASDTLYYTVREAIATGLLPMGTRLREEIARLGALAEPELSGGVLKQIAGKLDEEELLAVKRAYEKRLDERFPTAPQIKDTGGEREAQRDDVAFLI